MDKNESITKPNVRDRAYLIRDAKIPMIEAVTPLVLIGGGVLMAIFTMLIGTYIGNHAASLEKEAAQRRYEHSDKLMGLGNGIAAGLIGAGTAILRFRGDRREDEPFQPPTIDMGPSPGGYRPLSPAPRPMPPDAIAPGWPNPGPELDPPERSSDAWEGRRVGFRPPDNQAQATYDAAMASKAFKRLKDAAMALGDEFKLED